MRDIVRSNHDAAILRALGQSRTADLRFRKTVGSEKCFESKL